jgi:hypothetical protein
VSISITDPIVRVRTVDGINTVGLHVIFAHVHDGALIDLPGVRADQRAPVDQPPLSGPGGMLV